ncbi:MAG TPA: heavy metal-binding domain-containing protein [Chitinophagaceae bacterium]|nr:heavy metal-binding domain-containing protein [Chitinophagaceae bacterium]
MKRITILLFMAVATLTSFAQEKAGKKDTTHHVTLYSYACPMHHNFISDKPGKCPKCGMDLAQLSAKEQLKREVAKIYTCPVDADVISNEPGKCPKCGKNLLKSKKEQMKEEVVKKYACPMHPDITSDKPGKCSKCGMEMVAKKQATN